jgi:hypothetical protein
MKAWTMTKQDREGDMNQAKSVILEALIDDGFISEDEAIYLSKKYVLSLIEPAAVSWLWNLVAKTPAMRTVVLKTPDLSIRSIDKENGLHPTYIPDDEKEPPEPHDTILAKANLEIPDEVILTANNMIAECEKEYTQESHKYYGTKIEADGENRWRIICHAPIESICLKYAIVDSEGTDVSGLCVQCKNPQYDGLCECENK